jgi:hypothetical protein
VKYSIFQDFATLRIPIIEWDDVRDTDNVTNPDYDPSDAGISGVLSIGMVTMHEEVMITNILG